MRVFEDLTDYTMSDKKLFSLIDKFSPAEKRDFDTVMDFVSRDSLQRLYKSIKKKKYLLKDKEALFAEVFNESYAADKDYRLRHEFRLLTDKIKDFMILRQGEAENRENPSWSDFLLQKALIKRHLYKEYEAEFKKAYKKAQERLDYEVAQKMLNQYFNYLMTQPKISPEMIEKAHSILLDNLENIKYKYRTDVAINQQGRVAMEAFLKSFGKQVQWSKVGFDVDLKRNSNPYIRFFEFSALANQNGLEDRIKHAQQAEKNIGEVEDNFPKNRVDGLAMLAGAYYVARNYEDAAQYYQKAVAFQKKHKLPTRNDILFNYVSTLMKLDEYAMAIGLMTENDKSIQANPKVKHKFDYFHSMAHIFLGHYRQAKIYVPQNIGKLPEDEQHYFRFIYCILPYLSGDAEGAAREAGNFIAYFNHHGDSLAYPHEKYFAQAFKTFYDAVLDMPGRGETRKKALENVLLQIDELIVSYPQYADYLYVKWLRQEINGLA